MVPPTTDSAVDILNSFDVIRAEIRAVISSASTTLGSTRPSTVEMEPSSHAADPADAESRLTESAEQLFRLQEKFDAVTRQLDESNASQQVLTARLRHSLEQQAQAHRELESLRQQLADSQRSAAFLTERNTRLTKDHAALAAMHAGWKEWVDRVEAQTADTERCVTALRAENERLSGELAALSEVEKELTRRSQELAVAQRCAQEAEARVTAMAKARDEIGAAAQSALSSIADGQRFVDSLVECRRSMEEALARETTRCAELTQLLLQTTQGEACRRESVDGADSLCGVPHHPAPLAGTPPCSPGPAAASLQRVALLEGRVVDLTLKLNLSEEVKEAALLELQQLKDLLVAPLMDAMRDEEKRVRAPLSDRWDELQALWRRFSALTHFSCDDTSVGGTGQQTEGHHDNVMVGWHHSVEEISQKLVAQNACIEALRSENAALRMSRHHQQQTQNSAQNPSALHHQVPTSSPRARTSAAPSLNAPCDTATGSFGSRSCGICGWALQEGSAAMCVCRVCGDCYHRQCCHQSESRFICHKHEKAVGKPMTRLR